MENLSRDQRDTEFKACSLGPYILNHAHCHEIFRDNQGSLAIPAHYCGKYDVCMLFLRITAVESLRIRGLQNSSTRTCESNKGVF